MSKVNQFLIFGILFFMLSCSKDETSNTNNSLDCSANKPTYKNDIASILNSSCALSGCHSAASKSAGFDLSTFSGAKSASGSGSFLKSIKHESGSSKMPQGGSKLPDATITKIECWIKNGTPE